MAIGGRNLASVPGKLWDLICFMLSDSKQLRSSSMVLLVSREWPKEVRSMCQGSLGHVRALLRLANEGLDLWTISAR